MSNGEKRKLILELFNARGLEGQISEIETFASQLLVISDTVRIKLRFYLQFPGKSYRRGATIIALRLLPGGSPAQGSNSIRRRGQPHISAVTLKAVTIS